MLVLSRKRDEEIVIQTPSGEIITLLLVEIRGEKVRLGFTAEQKIIVHRKEVYDAIQRKKGEAA